MKNILMLIMVFSATPAAGPKPYLGEFFDNLDKIAQTLTEQQAFDSVMAIASKLDSNDIPYVLQRGNAEPALAPLCLMFLTGAVQNGAGKYGEKVVEYALREYARDTSLYEASRAIMVSIGEPTAGVVAHSFLTDRNLSRVIRRGIAEMWISVGGTAPIIFVLTERGLESDREYLLRSASAFDLLTAANEWQEENPILDLAVKEAKARLKQKEPLPFRPREDSLLDKDHCAVKIINEAPVSLVLTLLNESLDQRFEFHFPSRATRSYTMPLGRYFFKASSPTPFILPTEGFEDFKRNFIYEWVFFLEDQLEEMKEKYPDLEGLD
ncbi:hypothetical protein CEE36_08955 [candidate division TA06 bacterium B3_TA06]|uniref:Uncharacterized protein n=1 Tax=candidate division TA06 bacterium B3_TA06 TaxID=2012487 RepID=A0A532V190_UNCT6|nr:MAG: hypothetical protein CEE36_08955 [candidate division TA06 bacterium B3_TA06]